MHYNSNTHATLVKEREKEKRKIFRRTESWRDTVATTKLVGPNPRVFQNRLLQKIQHTTQPDRMKRNKLKRNGWEETAPGGFIVSCFLFNSSLSVCMKRADAKPLGI